MARAPISVQLYSVRDYLAQDLSKTLSRLAEIGFTAVEPFGLPSDAAQLKSGLEAAGLSAPTAHGGVLADPRAAFEAAASLHTLLLIDPYQPEAIFQNESELSRLADQLSDAAELGREYGISVGYHNHDHELRNEIAGIPALIALAEKTSEDVLFEIDLFWCQVAKVNPVDVLNALEGRVAALHIKDAPLGGGVENQVPAGQGSVPILESLSAVSDARAVLEFDQFAGDIFEALATGLEFLKSNGVDK